MQLLKKLVRTRQREVAKLIPTKANMTMVDFGQLMGASGHLPCAECGCPWLLCHHEFGLLTVACSKCNWSGKAVLPQPLDVQGDIRCGEKECACREMAVIAMNDVIGIGCRRCAWETRASIKPDKERKIIVVQE